MPRSGGDKRSRGIGAKFRSGTFESLDHICSNQRARPARSGITTGQREMGRKLGIGDGFPEMTLNLVDGGTLSLPTGLRGTYNIVLFYRGHW